MTKNAQSLRSLFRQRYVAGLALIAALVCASTFVFYEQASQQSGRAELINLASSQKALSQRIAFFVNAIAATSNEGERATLRAELRNAIDGMRAAHDLLSQKAETSARQNRQLSAIREIYDNNYAPFDADVQIFLDSAEKMLEDPPAGDLQTLLSEINLLGTQTIMQTHDVIALILTHKAEQALARTKTLQTGLMALILALLALESLVIFEPMGRKIEQSVRRAEESEFQAQAEADRARQANEAKSNFLRLMSHELRTPLNAVIGMTKLLKSTSLTPQQANFASHIDDAGRHMLTVADDILTINHHASGKMKLTPTPTRLRDEIRAVLDAVKSRADEKGLTLTFTDETGAEGDIAADRPRLRQLIYNLVCNAVKFTEQGDVAITARAEPAAEDPGARRIVIRIRDTGVGVPADKADRIFEEFEQAHALGARSYGGAGLGLAISRRIAEEMNGQIALEETSPAGSVFSITLRLPKADLPDAGADQTAPANAQRAGGKILVVDDNLPNRMIAAAYLKKAGYSVIFAENGQQAVEAVDRDQDVSLVLMDIEMPVMDGIAATRILRERHTNGKNRMPIIALTAHALPEDRDHLLSKGFDEVLRKPATEVDIVQYTRRFARLAA